MPGSSTVTIRPTADAAAPFHPTAANVGGAGSIHAALADNSDSTYIHDGGWTVLFGTSGVGALDYVQNVSFRIRAEQTGGALSTRNMTLWDPVTNKGVSWAYTVTEASPTTHTSPLFTSIGGTKITAAVLDRLVLYGSLDAGLRMYAVYVDINYNQPPTVSAVAPSGTIGSSSPAVSWLYSDPENDPQESFDIVVTPSAVVAQFGMTTAPTHLDLSAYVQHAVPSSAQSFSSSDLQLRPGGYRIWIRAFDQGSGGRLTEWAFADISVVTAPLATPRVTAGAYSEQFGRIPLLIEGSANLLSRNDSSANGSVLEYTLVNATGAIDATATGLWSPPNGPAIIAHSLKITLSSTATASAATADATGLGAVGVVIGQEYIAGAYVFSPVEALATAAIEWFDGAGTLLSTTTGRQTPTAAGSEPAPVSVVGGPPGGAETAAVKITIVGAAAASVHYIGGYYLMPTVGGPLRDSATWDGNLVANTSFEDYAGSGGIADWNAVTAGAGQTVSVVTTATVDGTQALWIAKLETALAPPYAEWPNLGGSVPRLPCAAGDVIVVEGYQHLILGTGVTVEAVYQDGTHDQVTCVGSGLSGFEPFVALFQIPTGKTGVSFRFLPVAVGATTAQGEHYIDLINVFFANPGVVAVFHSVGGASGTPKFGALGASSANLSMAVPPQPYFPWIEGGFPPGGLQYLVERSADGGVTWSTVRGLPALLLNLDNLTVFGYDYEAPPNARVLYRASALSSDPSGNPIVSALTVPALPDPGFEQQAWTGLSADPFAQQYQPIDGEFVGALDGTTAEMTSGFAPLPAWASFVGARFLARGINCAVPGTNFDFRFFDVQGNLTGNPNPIPVILTAAAGDSGWAWYEAAAPVSIPATAAFIGVHVTDPGPSDGAQPHLFLMDTVMLWIGAPGGLTNTAVTPTCLQWLKDPLDPGANLQINAEVINLAGAGNAAAAGHESVSTEAQLVMQPSGRSTPVIVADDVVSAETFGTIQLVLESDAEWATFERLRKAQRTLLLQLPYGDLRGEQYYVRLGDVRTVGRIQTQDQGRNQRRRVTVAAREVDAP